jgi:dTDP-4-dehydrorhamnose 3,5-epimerase
VICGEIQDVFVDLRPHSPAFGHPVSIELKEGKSEALYVPRGFAHGFCTLAEDTLVQYLVDAPYHPGDESGILWNDPALKIAWSLDPAKVLCSARDWKLPKWEEQKSALFRFEHRWMENGE